MSRAPYFKASRRKAKVEGSLIRLFKAKEGSRKHEAPACLNILQSIRPKSNKKKKISPQRYMILILLIRNGIFDRTN